MTTFLRSSARVGPSSTRSLRSWNLDEFGSPEVREKANSSPTAGQTKNSDSKPHNIPTHSLPSPVKRGGGQSNTTPAGGSVLEDEEEDDGDDESDQPAPHAPSYRKRQGRKAGRNGTTRQNRSFSPFEDEMFATSREQVLASSKKLAGMVASDFEVASSEDDDAATYQQVEDISDDSDDGDDDSTMEHYEEAALLSEFADVDGLMIFNGLSDSERPENYGLGDPPDDFSAESPSEDSAAGTSNVKILDSDSLASGEPVTALTTLKARDSIPPSESTLLSPVHPTTFLDMDLDYDSMLFMQSRCLQLTRLGDKTDEDTPRPPTASPDALTLPPPTPRTSASKNKSARKGPPLGLFSIDPNLSWSTLDETRTKILIMPRADTGSHDWLDQCKNRKRDTSSANHTRSPSSSLSTSGFIAHNHSSSQSIIDQTMVTGAVNPIMAGLIHGTNEIQHGPHITGPPEAFNPPNISTTFPIGDNVFDSQDELGLSLFNDEDAEMSDTALESFIQLEETTSDEEGRPASSMGPPQTPPVRNSSRNSSAFAHVGNLNSDLVTAFRRHNSSHASPTSLFDFSAAFTPGHALMRDAYQSPQRALSRLPHGHKRKASHEVYQSSHYNGVTPVGRKILKTSHRLKRRKTTS